MTIILLLFFAKEAISDQVEYKGIIYSQIDFRSYGVGTIEKRSALNDKNPNIRIDSKISVGNKFYDVTQITQYAFYECTYIYSIVLPETIVSIGKHAFHGCIMLETIVIPNLVTSIGEYCFTQCSSLNYIQLSSSLKEIGPFAFQMCQVLRFIALPSTLSHIGKGAFSSCPELVLITYDGRNPIDEVIFGETTNQEKLQIYVTCDYHSNTFGRVVIHNPCTGNNKKILLINRVMAIFIGCFTIGVLFLFKSMG